MMGVFGFLLLIYTCLTLEQKISANDGMRFVCQSGGESENGSTTVFCRKNGTICHFYLHWDFETLNNLQVIQVNPNCEYPACVNLTRQITFDPRVSGKIGYAMRTNHSAHQGINLGHNPLACMNVMAECGPAGGAISFWFKLIECRDGDILMTAASRTRTSWDICCINYNELHCRFVGPKYLLGGRIDNVPNNVWTHFIVNLVQPNERLGTMVYIDGKYHNQTLWTTLWGYEKPVDPIKDYNITIGYDAHRGIVATVEVDELYIFNKGLTAEEIKILSNVESYP